MGVIQADSDVPVATGLAVIQVGQEARRVVGVRCRIESLLHRGKCMRVQRQIDVLSAAGRDLRRPASVARSLQAKTSVTKARQP